MPGIVGTSKATVFASTEEQLGQAPATINHNISAAYFHQNIFTKTDFSWVFFNQNIKARFNYSDFFNGQSFIQSSKYGSRLDFVSNFSSKIRMHYGVDFLRDQGGYLKKF